MNDHNTLFHISKMIMQSRCILDCYFQVIISIYSMKRLHSILHSGIVLKNSTILSPFGPAIITILLLIQLMTSTEVDKRKRDKSLVSQAIERNNDTVEER